MPYRVVMLVGFAAVGAAGCVVQSDVPSAAARDVARYADTAFATEAIGTLADLVAFRTVRVEGVPNAENRAFRAMTGYLERTATRLGLDFADHGSVVVVGLGAGSDRLGLVAHGDVVPADPATWAHDPFALDTVSEPGRLLGRGTVDDKAGIAAALYAMKAVADRGPPLGRRVELIISYTEESDWTPFLAFLRDHPPPQLNVGLDSEYPVVVAEKSWNTVHLGVPAVAGEDTTRPSLAVIEGGRFLSQIPEDARAVITGATPELVRILQAAAAADSLVTFEFVPDGSTLRVQAKGRAAHSAVPESGRNAITHLAALLGVYPWPDGQGARMVRLINELVGIGDYGERFGDVALTHPFMGPLTLSLTTLGLEGDTLVAGVSLRSPVGRSADETARVLREAVVGWTDRTGIAVTTRISTSEAYYLEDAPHVPVLLDVFAHYTGRRDPRPIAIGGGTNARLLPNGVNFGPAMPGEPYPGHSEHEFITREQFRLNLRMYAALIVELASRG